MKKWVPVVLIGAIIVLSAAVWANETNETNRWAVIEDINGDRMAVEPTSDNIWSELVQMYQNGTEMWVGGIVERYNNEWGFRFKPDTVTVAEVTAEGLQATIELISADIDYWENLGWAYVSSRVVEIHS